MDSSHCTGLHLLLLGKYSVHIIKLYTNTLAVPISQLGKYSVYVINCIEIHTLSPFPGLRVHVIWVEAVGSLSLPDDVPDPIDLLSEHWVAGDVRQVHKLQVQSPKLRQDA